MGKFYNMLHWDKTFFRNFSFTGSLLGLCDSKILMIWGFKLHFDRLSYTRNMKLFLANADNYFNTEVTFPLMTHCPNFPFHMAIFHTVVPESRKGKQLSLRPITFYCNEQSECMICIHRRLGKDSIFFRHDKQGLPTIIQ